MLPQPERSFSRIADALSDSWALKARPEQRTPAGDWWSVWLICSGRGWGKTETGSQWVHESVRAGIGRIAIVCPTAADCRDVAVEGPAGILATAPKHARPLYEPSKRRVVWDNGAIATLFSGDEPERLRGPQHGALWFDELGAMQYAQEVWDMAMFGLRLGKKPRTLVTTTPRPIKLLRDLLARVDKDVYLTRGRTADNAANLAASFLETVVSKYQGTRLGRQELEGELLDDYPGALFQRWQIDRDRVSEAPELVRVVVALDPSISTGENSDESGIVVAGKDTNNHGYILEDFSGRLSPDEWGRRVVDLYRKYGADRIVAEKNQGGDMVEHTIKTIDPHAPVKLVSASKGKMLRAEPVSALYEQGRVHHVGSLPFLEDQMSMLTPDFDRKSAGFSPDRVDALVWALTELIVTDSVPRLVRPSDLIIGPEPLPLPTWSRYVVSIFATDEVGQTATVFAAKCLEPPFLRILDFGIEPIHVDLFRNIGVRTRELALQCRAHDGCAIWAPSNLVTHAMSSGIRVYPIPDDLRPEKLMVSVASHVGNGCVRLCEPAAEKNKEISFLAALDFREGANEALRNAALYCISLCLDIK